MATLAESLRALHRIHQQLADLQERLARGPKQTKAAEANVKKGEAEVVEAKEILKKAKIAADQQQLTLKQREARIHDLKGKLNAANNNKEFQLLKEQIAADLQATSVLADEILEALEKLELLQANVKTAEANLVKTKEEFAKVRSRVEAAQQGLESELARVSSERDAAEENVPEDFRPDYSRVAKVRGADAMAPVEGECCGGCYQTLTPQTHDLLRRDKPVFCKNCGRLLYIAE